MERCATGKHLCDKHLCEAEEISEEDMAGIMARITENHREMEVNKGNKTAQMKGDSL